MRCLAESVPQRIAIDQIDNSGSLGRGENVMSVVDLFQQIAENDFGFFQQVHSVGDIMVADPPALSLDDSFSDAQRLFDSHKTCHAPVINPDDETVVGILSDRDLLRWHPRLLGKAAEGDDDHRVLDSPVSAMMTRHPVLCRQSDSPVEAMSLMLSHHIDSVLVYDDADTMVGIVTPQKLMQTLLVYHRVCTRDFELKRLRLVDLDFRNGIPLDEIFARGAQTVRDVMTKAAITISGEQTIADAIQAMQDKEIRHLPVVKPDGKLQGMLTDRDILRFLPTPKSKPDSNGRFRSALFSSDCRSSLGTPVEKLMTTELPAVDPETLLTDAMKIFHTGTISGVPVTSRDTNVTVGILTTTDVMRVFRVVMQLGEGRMKESTSPTLN